MRCGAYLFQSRALGIPKGDEVCHGACGFININSHPSSSNELLPAGRQGAVLTTGEPAYGAARASWPGIGAAPVLVEEDFFVLLFGSVPLFSVCGEGGRHALPLLRG